VWCRVLTFASTPCLYIESGRKWGTAGSVRNIVIYLKKKLHVYTSETKVILIFIAIRTLNIYEHSGYLKRIQKEYENSIDLKQM
jgi:hypothetical protein